MVPRAVAIGAQVQYVPAKKTVRMTHEGMVAVLSLDENGKRKTWLLTGWEEGKPDARGEVGTRTAATQPGPTFSRTELAGFLDTIAAPGGPVKNDEPAGFGERQSASSDESLQPAAGSESTIGERDNGKEPLYSRATPPDPDTAEGSAEGRGSDRPSGARRGARMGCGEEQGVRGLAAGAAQARTPACGGF